MTSIWIIILMNCIYFETPCIYVHLQGEGVSMTLIVIIWYDTDAQPHRVRMGDMGRTAEWETAGLPYNFV